MAESTIFEVYTMNIVICPARNLQKLLDTELKYRALFCERPKCKNLKYYKFNFCANHSNDFLAWCEKLDPSKRRKPVRYGTPGVPLLWWRIVPSYAWDYLIKIEKEYKKFFCEKEGCDALKYYRFRFCDMHTEGYNHELDDPNRPAFQPLCPPGEGTKV